MKTIVWPVGLAGGEVVGGGVVTGGIVTGGRTGGTGECTGGCGVTCGGAGRLTRATSSAMFGGAGGAGVADTSTAVCAGASTSATSGANAASDCVCDRAALNEPRASIPRRAQRCAKRCVGRLRALVVDPEQRALQRDRDACVSVVPEPGKEMQARKRERNPERARDDCGA